MHLKKTLSALLFGIPAVGAAVLQADHRVPTDEGTPSKTTPSHSASPGTAAAFAWHDVNQDGRDDAFAVTADGRGHVLVSEADGSFADVTEAYGLASVGPIAAGQWGDVDSDGLADLLLVGADGRVALWRNVGEGFADVTPTAGLLDEPVGDATLFDYDADGRLDLHVVTDVGHRLYHNEGDGSFLLAELDLPETASVVGGGPVIAPLAGDAARHETEMLSGDGDRTRDQAHRASSVDPGTSGGSSPALGPPSGGPVGGVCAMSVLDAAGGSCILASTVPTLGMLYPISGDLFVEAGSGNVGIGTTTPAARLDVVGGAVRVHGSNGMIFHRSSDDSAGVQIGTDANASAVLFNDAGNARSEIRGTSGGTEWEVFNGSFDVLNGGQIRHTFAGGNGKAVLGLTEGIAIGGGLPNGDIFGVYKDTAFGSVPGDDAIFLAKGAGTLEFRKPSGDPALFFSGDGNPQHDSKLAIAVRDSLNADKITLRRNGELFADGPVGIGMTPSRPLDVAGVVRSTSGGFEFPDGSVQTTAASGTGGGIGGTGTTGRLPVFTGPTTIGDSGIVESSGNVGIGTPIPLRPLHVDGGTDVTPTGGGFLLLGDESTNNIAIDNNEIMARNNGSPVALFLNSEGGTIVLGNTNGDNVGVGTSAPSAKLDVREGAARSSRFASQFTEIKNVDASGGFLRSVSSEGNKKTLYIDNLHDGTGSPVGNNFILFRTGSEAAPSEHMRIRDNGHVSIGTGASSASRLQVVSSTNTGSGASIRGDNTGLDYALWGRSAGNFLPTLNLQNVGGGPLIWGSTGGSTTFEVTSTGRVVTTALEITGGGDLVEGFETSDDEVDPGTVVVIDPENPGKLIASSTPYDPKVAGAVSGAGGVNHGIRMGQNDVLDGDTLVAMTGRVYVKCTTENGPVAPGDRLTTSSLAGHAMKATDADRSDGAVIGKAMSALSDGTGLVLVLVNLQ